MDLKMQSIPSSSRKVLILRSFFLQPFQLMLILLSFNFQKEQQDQLKKGLAGLPTPRNDYEIVIPENEAEGMEADDATPAVEDQSDVDARNQAEIAAESVFWLLCSIAAFKSLFPMSGFFCLSEEREMKKRSQSVQRDLPRPIDVNHTVLRPSGKDDPPLTELQKVCLSSSCIDCCTAREVLCLKSHPSDFQTL